MCSVCLVGRCAWALPSLACTRRWGVGMMISPFTISRRSSDRAPSGCTQCCLRPMPTHSPGWASHVFLCGGGGGGLCALARGLLLRAVLVMTQLFNPYYSDCPFGVLLTHFFSLVLSAARGGSSFNLLPPPTCPCNLTSASCSPRPPPHAPPMAFRLPIPITVSLPCAWLFPHPAPALLAPPLPSSRLSLRPTPLQPQ